MTYKFPSNYRSKARPKEVALDAEVLRLSREGSDAHFPSTPAYARVADRGTAKWACGGCDYWTGYRSRHMANQMILNHCNAKNSEETS